MQTRCQVDMIGGAVDRVQFGFHMMQYSAEIGMQTVIPALIEIGFSFFGRKHNMIM